MNTQPIQYKAVALTPYEWHCLLRDLEFLLTISNRNADTTKALYNFISSQLHDEPVKVTITAP